MQMGKAATLIAAIALTVQTGICTDKALAQAGAVALAGVVSSQREGPMEGVLVSASKQGTGITVTVVTGDKGAYTFPAGRLEPGVYQLSIRATGYALEGTGSATVAADVSAKAH